MDIRTILNIPPSNACNSGFDYMAGLQSHSLDDIDTGHKLSYIQEDLGASRKLGKLENERVLFV